MRKKLKIMEIIVQNKLRSGGGIQMFLLSKELVKRGHEVCAVYNMNGHIEEDFEIFDNTGIDINFLKMSRLTISTKSLDTIISLRKLICKKKIDIIHAHKGNAVDLSLCATIGMKIPIVTNRGVNIPLGFFQSLKYRANKIKKIIAVSQAVKDVIVKTGRINPEKVVVVYGSVDIDRFNPEINSNLRQELGIPDDMRIVGFVGNPNPRKGLKYLISTFEELCKKKNNIALILVGVSESDTNQFPINEKIRNRIFPIGFRKDIPNCMAALNVYVFPGVKDEGLTGTLREAAAMGLPVITTDVAGNRELISDGYNGIVIPPMDTEKLTQAISFLLDNKETAGMYGMKAREFVEKNMNNAIRAKTVENIYYEAIESL